MPVSAMLKGQVQCTALDPHRFFDQLRAMIKTLRLPPTPEGLQQAGALIAAGKLVAFPTETVYGLGCDASNPEAVARLYAAKGRPRFNPLIAHIAVPDDAGTIALLPPLAEHLAARFWPGPLTLVVPVRPGGSVCELARAGLPSVAVRCPAHPAARALIAAAGRPVAAPSANRSGHISPTTAAHVLDDLGGIIDAIVMGDAAAVGLESTIIAIDGDQATLLRPGGLAREVIEAAMGRPLLSAQHDDEGAPVSPGRLSSHYAPRAKVRLDTVKRLQGDAVLDFHGQFHDRSAPYVDLSETGNLAEAAARLYGALRDLDAGKPESIAIAPIPADGLGEALNDRLRRAAATT
jgi:L-threonylcarbamoyladenylate synthase